MGDEILVTTVPAATFYTISGDKLLATNEVTPPYPDMQLISTAANEQLVFLFWKKAGGT